MFYRLVSRLPFPLLYAAAWCGYLLLYYVVRYRRDTVRQNLSRAFPEKNEREVTELGKKFYRQLCQVALEIIKAARMSRADFRERVTLENPELLRDCSEGFTRSIIVLTIHQGNWEWMLHGATTALDIPIDPVYKPLHNEELDRLIFDIRSRFGSRPLSMAQSTRDILRRRREFRLFVMVADQAPIRGERGYWTTFMNQEAVFYEGAEAIARTTGFPVIFAQCRRRSRGRYHVTFHEIARPPYPREGHAIIDRYVQCAERAIRAEPESWLWSNRRWKRNREEEARAEAAAGNP